MKLNLIEMRFNVAVPAGGQTQEEPLKKLRHNLKRRRSLHVAKRRFKILSHEHRPSMILFVFCFALSVLSHTTQAFVAPVPKTADRGSGRTIGIVTVQQHDSALAMADGLTSCWAKEQGVELIQRFGGIFEPEDEKLYALENLALSPSQEIILDSALQEIEQAKTSSLARKRLPIRMPSRRATAGCYGRILAEANAGRLEGVIAGIGLAEKADADDVNQQRVNLLLLLRNLSTFNQGVWSLEGELIEDTGIQDFGALYGEAFQ